MTLTTHALVGAAAASLFPEHPYAAFAAGFVSHFAIDALPHWDYRPASLKKDRANPLNTDMVLDKRFFLDLLVIGGDAVLGLVLSITIFYFWLFHAPLLIVCIGAGAGLFPDALQFFYFKTRSKMLEPLQKFHIWVQKGKSLQVPAWLGIGLQCALVLLVILFLRIV
jgi:hypothetical protein